MFCYLGLDLLVEVIEKVGYIGKIKIGMDVVVFEFFKEFKYDLDFKNLKFNLVDWVGIYIFIKMK